jgi:hypothetical protein
MNDPYAFNDDFSNANKNKPKVGSLIIPLILSFLGGFFLVFSTYNISCITRLGITSPVVAKMPSKPKSENTNNLFSVNTLLPVPASEEDESLEMLDVFADRTGISNTNSMQAFIANPSGMNSSSVNFQEQSNADRVPDFYERYRNWQQTVRASREANKPVPSVETVYMLSDMEAVGTTSGRSGKEVLLYISPEKRVISASIGTKFYDSELVKIDSEGPQFRKNNGRIEVLTWARSQPKENKPDQELPPVQKKTDPATNNANSQATNNDLEHLQEAVQDRYKGN